MQRFENSTCSISLTSCLGNRTRRIFKMCEFYFLCLHLSIITRPDFETVVNFWSSRKTCDVIIYVSCSFTYLKDFAVNIVCLNVLFHGIISLIFADLSKFN